jgi:hypothetical protein
MEFPVVELTDKKQTAETFLESCGVRFSASGLKLEVKRVAVASHPLLTSTLASALGSLLSVALSSVQVLSL